MKLITVSNYLNRQIVKLSLSDGKRVMFLNHGAKHYKLCAITHTSALTIHTHKKPILLLPNIDILWL